MVPPSSNRISRVPPYLSLAQYHKSIFEYGIITLYDLASQPIPLILLLSLTGSFAFARRYSQNLGWFLFLGVLRCFSSPGSPHLPMNSVSDSRFFIYWVSPFGHLGLNASYRLIQAFRRLARPSSPLIAKASTLYALSLSHTTSSILRMNNLMKIKWNLKLKFTLHHRLMLKTR